MNMVVYLTRKKMARHYLAKSIPCVDGVKGSMNKSPPNEQV